MSLTFDKQKYKTSLNVEFGPITDKIIEQLRTLNLSIFPGQTHLYFMF